MELSHVYQVIKIYMHKYLIKKSKANLYQAGTQQEIFKDRGGFLE